MHMCIALAQIENVDLRVDFEGEKKAHSTRWGEWEHNARFYCTYSGT